MLKQNEVLKNKNVELKMKLGRLKPFVNRFTLSSQKLDMILGTQQAVFDKAGLGYKNSYKSKTTENLYKKSTYENLICYYCGKLGHKTYTCNVRRTSTINKKKTIWIVKGSRLTNHEKPKKVWVPKHV